MDIFAEKGTNVDRQTFTWGDLVPVPISKLDSVVIVSGSRSIRTLPTTCVTISRRLVPIDRIVNPTKLPEKP